MNLIGFFICLNITDSLVRSKIKIIEMYDLIIIGGGPIGLACGLEAQKVGLNYAVLEKGCLVNSIYNYPANMSFFSTSERLELDDIPFVSNSAKPTRSEALEYYRRVAFHRKLNVKLFEEVETIHKKSNDFYEIITKKMPTTPKALSSLRVFMIFRI